MNEQLRAGISEFNAGRFFEAHEVLEEMWREYRETDRLFLQGLIQIAAGLYHLQCNNLRGAASQLRKGRAKLSDYLPRHAGVETGTLVGRIDDLIRRLEHGESAGGTAPTIETNRFDTSTIC